MTKINRLISIVFFIICLSCVNNHPRGLQQHIMNNEIKKNETIVGEISSDELFQELPLFHVEYEEFQPHSDFIQKLKNKNENIHFLVFFGSWCSDSEKYVPKMMKIFDEVNHPQHTLQLVGVNVYKRDDKNMAIHYDIKKVPTIIILKNGKELGRIVETPKVSIEKDLLQIL